MVPFAIRSWPSFAIAVVGALLASFVLVGIVALIVRGIARRRAWRGDPVAHLRRPFRALTVVVLLWIAVDVTWPLTAWIHGIDHGFLILTIIAGGLLVGALLGAFISHAMGRYNVDVADNRVARKARTQLAIVQRLAYAVVALLILGSVLLTFPSVQEAGTSVLASAGVVSVIAGLAAQSTLANLFAGIQLAFSGAIRIDDVVVVESQWGRIEEITLSYVVLHIWDDRRMVLPSTYFTTTPFENWTRTSSQLLGSVDFDLDWRVSAARMREELDRIMTAAPLWDGRVKVLQLTDAVGGEVHLRVLVSAKDAPTLFDLRCFVREQLIDWLQRESPDSLPVQRIQVADAPSRPAGARKPATKPVPAIPAVPAADESTGRRQPEGLFSGSPDAEERARHFTTPIPIVPPAGADAAPSSARELPS